MPAGMVRRTLPLPERETKADVGCQGNPGLVLRCFVRDCVPDIQVPGSKCVSRALPAESVLMTPPTSPSRVGPSKGLACSVRGEGPIHRIRRITCPQSLLIQGVRHVASPCRALKAVAVSGGLTGNFKLLTMAAFVLADPASE